MVLNHFINIFIHNNIHLETLNINLLKIEYIEILYYAIYNGWISYKNIFKTRRLYDT